MKRTLSAVLAAAGAVSLLLTASLPSHAQGRNFKRRPATTPFIAPQLFEGFEPIPPDRFGFSPDQRYLVFQDEDGLTVVDLETDRVAFRERFTGRFGGTLEVGFDPLDNRLFLLSRVGGAGVSEGPWRFRLVDPDTGAELFDRLFQTRPEIRTNQDATVNLLVQRRFAGAEVLLVNRIGRPVLRRRFAELVQWGISQFGTAIAFITPQGLTRSAVEVYNARSGIRTLSQRVERTTEIGFEPFGPAFVVATPTSTDRFRVRMINGASGRLLVSESFFGVLNAGFTPDSSFLGVRNLSRFEDQLFLFRTKNGRRLFLR